MAILPKAVLVYAVDKTWTFTSLEQLVEVFFYFSIVIITVYTFILFSIAYFSLVIYNDYKQQNRKDDIIESYETVD